MKDTTEIIGVHGGHNASIARVVNGHLHFAIQEERLTRVKNQGGLPLKTLGLLDQCPEVAWAGSHLFNSAWNRDDVLKAYDNNQFKLKDILWSRVRRTEFVGEYMNVRREGAVHPSLGSSSMPCLFGLFWLGSNG